MKPLPLCILLLCLPVLNYASEVVLSRRADVSEEGFYNPVNDGGSFLTVRSQHLLFQPVGLCRQ